MKINSMTSPKLSFNQMEANVLAITEKKDNINQWIYNNFIHLMVAENAHWGCFLFDKDIWEDCPWIKKSVLDRDVINLHYKRITDYIMDCINRDKYVYMFIVRKYINNYEIRTDNKACHDIFIYGYDEQKEILYIADFFKNGKYELATCSFIEFENAYYAFEKEFYDGLGGVWEVKVSEKEVKYEFSPQMVKHSLMDYLKGIYPHSKYRYFTNDMQNYKFGIDVYEVLIKHCENIKEKKENRVDFRIFDLMYEQKNLMVERIDFMSKNKYLKENNKILPLFIKLCEELLILRNRYIKYTIVRKNEMLDDILGKLKLIKKKEADFTEMLIGLIDD